MSKPHQYVIRFTLRQIILLGGVFCTLAVIAAGCFGVIYFLWGIFGTSNVKVAESNSPDGLHRVVVIEESSTAQATTHIRLYRRSGDDWTLRRKESVYNDSACRSNYSIVWTIDAHHAPTKVAVFGDFGTPPFPGNVIFTESLP